MTTSMLLYEYDDDEEGLVLNEEPMGGGTTPIWTLINNRNAHNDSIAALCEYWPPAAFLRNELGETTLLRLLRNGAEPECNHYQYDGPFDDFLAFFCPFNQSTAPVLENGGDLDGVRPLTV